MFPGEFEPIDDSGLELSGYGSNVLFGCGEDFKQFKGLTPERVTKFVLNALNIHGRIHKANGTVPCTGFEVAIDRREMLPYSPTEKRERWLGFRTFTAQWDPQKRRYDLIPHTPGS